jgi:hypothetical protein
MSELKVIGTITTISAIEDAGAGKKLTFKLDVGDSYNDNLQFEMYKGADHVSHLDSFIKFNKVGDLVDVEFKLKSKEWTNPTTKIEKTFTSLSCWRVEKVGEAVAVGNEPFPETAPDTGDALPF